jgi:tetratricopeptide (TPR) repeat protein
MSKNIELAALKHEADIYLSHGLHHEAIALIARFVSKNAHLGSHTISALEKWMGLIMSTKPSEHLNEKELISEVEISLLKKGWDARAKEGEHLTSAGVLAELGYYQHALEEYQRLLAKRCMKAAVFKGAAECMVHLHEPDQFAAAVDRFANEVFKDPRNRHACIVNIARALGSEQYPRYFSALFNHLANISWG